MDHRKNIRITSAQKIKIRKKNLFERLETEKLKYIENGICDQYIKYDKNKIEDVIENIKNKELIETERLERLLEGIKKTGTYYDENISWYRDYIKRGGNLERTIKNGSIEWFYIHKTEYPRLLLKYRDEDIAQNKALHKYIKKNGCDKYVEKIRKNDMVIRLSI